MTPEMVSAFAWPLVWLTAIAAFVLLSLRFVLSLKQASRLQKHLESMEAAQVRFVQARCAETDGNVQKAQEATAKLSERLVRLENHVQPRRTA